MFSNSFLLCFPMYLNAGQKVTNLDELELNVCRKGMLVKTNKNEQVTADLVICCTGNKISSEAYRSSLSKCFFVCNKWANSSLRLLR